MRTKLTSSKIISRPRIKTPRGDLYQFLMRKGEIFRGHETSSRLPTAESRAFHLGENFLLQCDQIWVIYRHLGDFLKSVVTKSYGQIRKINILAVHMNVTFSSEICFGNYWGLCLKNIVLLFYSNQLTGHTVVRTLRTRKPIWSLFSFLFQFNTSWTNILTLLKPHST